MRKKKKSRTRYFIQPWWLVKRWCAQEGLTAPTTKSFDAKILDLVKEKKMGLDALGYYLYRICHNQLTSRWMTTEAEELGVTKETLKRLRSELRKLRLMTTVSLGNQTYTVTHRSVLSEADHKRLTTTALAAFKANWALSQRLNIDCNFRAVLGMLQATAEAVTMNKKYVRSRPLRFAICNVEPRQKGVDRLKAVGLWVILQTRGLHYNWKSPEFIASELRLLSAKPVRKLCEQLISIGLMYYCDKRRVIALSLFPRGRWENLNPLNFKPLSTRNPWIIFRYKRNDPPPEVWEKERKITPIAEELLRPAPAPLGFSRQPKVTTPHIEQVRELMARERTALELKQTGKAGWKPQPTPAASAKTEAEAEIDLQSYADGEDW